MPPWRCGYAIRAADDGVFVSINTNLTPYILYSARQNDFSSIALVVNDTALSTLTNSLIDPQNLPQSPFARYKSKGCR
jgi:hypothetical protein